MYTMINGRWIDVEGDKSKDHEIRYQIAAIMMKGENICTEGSTYDCLVCAQEIIDSLRSRKLIQQ